ncbi:MAG: DsbE family thiol:disulfide interchange protein [Proteobacteria bacterium]|nr:DsbE family thiol:disulfide interchange protein [Pseudomonadota bacterium]
MARSRTSRTLLWAVPFVLFVVLAGFLFTGLFRDPREVPSPLIDKPAPAFTLPKLGASDTLSAADLRGKVWLLNVWASWCVSCRYEHPLLVELAKANVVPIVGLNYKDKNDLALAWLAERGDPYWTSIVDADGRVGIDWGVYGVPETFVVDKAGVIRYKQIGPLTADVIEKTIVPLVRQLEKS